MRPYIESPTHKYPNNSTEIRVPDVVFFYFDPPLLLIIQMVNPLPPENHSFHMQRSHIKGGQITPTYCFHHLMFFLAVEPFYN